MNRHTLGDYLAEHVPGVSVTGFARGIGVTPEWLQKQYAKNRVLVRLIVAGYKSEVRGG